MEKKTEFIKREQRFSLDDLHGVNVIVRRVDGTDTEEIPAKLLDFSRNGIKLRLPVNVQFEERLLVRIEFDNSSLSYLGEACVRHMRSDDGNKTFQVGCRVEPAIPNCVIEYLAENSGKERRTAQRTAIQVDAILIRQGNVEESIARVLNYSEGGFSAWVPSEHAVNEGIRLKIMNPHGESKTISGRILWQEPARDGGYRIGCRFTEVKSYEKLLTCVPVPLPLYQRIAIEDKVKWYVIAAALLALLLPPSISLLLQSNDEQPAVAKAGTQTVQTQEFAESKTSLQLFPEDQSSKTVDRPNLLATNNFSSGLNEMVTDHKAENLLANQESVSQGSRMVAEEPFVASTSEFAEPETEVGSDVSPFEVVFDNEATPTGTGQNEANLDTTESSFTDESVQIAVQNKTAKPNLIVNSKPVFVPNGNDGNKRVSEILEELETSSEQIVEAETVLVPKTEDFAQRETVVTPNPQTQTATRSGDDWSRNANTSNTNRPKRKHHIRRIQKSYQAPSQFIARRQSTRTHSVAQSPVVARPKAVQRPSEPTRTTKPTTKTEFNDAPTQVTVKPRTTNAVGRWIVRHVGPWMPEELFTSTDYRQPARTSSKNSSRRENNGR